MLTENKVPLSKRIKRPRFKRKETTNKMRVKLKYIKLSW